MSFFEELVNDVKQAIHAAEVEKYKKFASMINEAWTESLSELIEDEGLRQDLTTRAFGLQMTKALQNAVDEAKKQNAFQDLFSGKLSPAEAFRLLKNYVPDDVQEDLKKLFQT